MNVSMKSAENDAQKIPIEEVNTKVISKYKTGIMLLIKNIGDKETEKRVMEDFNKLENYYTNQLNIRGLRDPYDINSALWSLVDGTKVYLEVSNKKGGIDKDYLEYLLQKADNLFKEE